MWTMNIHLTIVEGLEALSPRKSTSVIFGTDRQTDTVVNNTYKHGTAYLEAASGILRVMPVYTSSITSGSYSQTTRI